MENEINEAEAVLSNLKVGDLIQGGANGRWSTPARLIRIEDVRISGYGGSFRSAEWESGTGNGSISGLLTSRDLGRFWKVA